MEEGPEDGRGQGARDEFAETGGGAGSARQRGQRGGGSTENPGTYVSTYERARNRIGSMKISPC